MVCGTILIALLDDCDESDYQYIMYRIWLVDSWFNQAAGISSVLLWWAAEFTKWLAEFVKKCGP